MGIAPIIHHVDQIERAVDNEAGKVFDLATPGVGVVKQVGVVCERREAEETQG